MIEEKVTAVSPHEDMITSKDDNESNESNGEFIPASHYITWLKMYFLITYIMNHSILFSTKNAYRLSVLLGKFKCVIFRLYFCI